MSPVSASRLLVCLVLAGALRPSGAPATPDCEQILEKPGELYILGIFGICDEEGIDLAPYVFAQAFRFSFTESNLGLTLGYKLMTFCEQPAGCPEKILTEIVNNHLEGHQTVVGVFHYGPNWPASLVQLNVPQVEVYINRIRVKGTFQMEDYEDALESLGALMKHFQWNLAGLIHYYDPEFTNMISEFDQKDNVDICLEFQEKASYNGKHLAERIATSQSNVTLTIDQGYAAICYMQTAIERGEAAQITGKQIVSCCGETIFEMEEFVPSAFQGVLSLFRRPRQLSGFQDFLLGFGTSGLENTTFNHFYNTMCQSCTSNPTSFKPCRNFQTSMKINPSTGSFNVKKLVDCPGGSIDICSECVTSLASLDTIFSMNFLIKTIAMETEDIPKSQQSALAQNSSSFDHLKYLKLWKNKHSETLPINKNPFDVYYWNITADGEMVLLKVDIDLGTGISRSYDPVDRSIQLSNGRVVTMLPSHCLQSCQPGEKKKLSNNLPQVCCYKCEICEPGTYSNGSAFEECWSCPMDEWSHKGEQSCWKKSVLYMFWSEPISIFFVILSISGILLTILVLGLHMKHKDTPIVKAAGGLVFYISMASLICSFASILLYFGEPTLWKCKIRRPIFGVSFAVCLSSILAKCVRILCAFASPVGRPTKLQATLYQVILGTGSALQLIITSFWLFLDPPGVRLAYPKNQPYVIIECFNEVGIGFSFLIGYLCFLAFICISVAIKGHALPKTFNDSQGISFMIMTFFAVWLSVMPVLDSGKERASEMVCIVSSWLSSFSCLAFLFFHKCYIILFKPHQNTSEWIKKSTFEYCQKIASKADLSIQLESSIETIETSS